MNKRQGTAIPAFDVNVISECLIEKVRLLDGLMYAAFDLNIL